MILSVILWLVFGALAGWLASLIMRTDAQQGALANIAIGIVGALIGGGVSRLIGGPGVSGFNIVSLIIAILGAVVFIFLLQLIRGDRSLTNH